MKRQTVLNAHVLCNLTTAQGIVHTLPSCTPTVFYCSLASLPPYLVFVYSGKSRFMCVGFGRDSQRRGEILIA